MTEIICDVTKKIIPNAQRDVNYVTIRDKTVSMPAKEKIEQKVKEMMQNKSRYTMKEYWKLYWDVTQKMAK
ncbi:MAG: hypothetical protein JW874_12475 [Spirochaetales bacterium]|nr:hypothetical protein [Spirochaetales bacterium]